MIAEKEKRLELALEKERGTVQRQSLLKRLWSLRSCQPRQSEASDPSTDFSETTDTPPIIADNNALATSHVHPRSGTDAAVREPTTNDAAI